MPKIKVISKKNASVKPEDAWSTYKRLNKLVKPFLATFLLAVVASIGYSGIDSLFAYLLKPILDKGFIQPDPRFLKWLPLLIIILFVFRAIFNLVSSYCMGLVSRNVVMGLRRDVFKQFLNLPCSFYDKHASGELLSVLIYNASQISSSTTNAIITIVQSGALIIGLTTVMFIMSWQLSLVFIATVPLIALFVKLTGKHMRRLSKKAQKKMAVLTHIAQETLEGYRVIRIFGGKTTELKKFNEATQEQMRYELKQVVMGAISSSSVQLLGIAALAIMIFMATNHWGVGGNMSAGAFTAVVASMMALLKPMRNLTSVNSTIQRALAAAESIFFLLDEPNEPDEGTLKLTKPLGEIQYHNVSFAYNKQSDLALKQINLKIPQGKCFAFVGRSGSGKSTLMSLLPRFYPIGHGKITIGGIDTANIELSSLRDQFALVSQNITLFNDTIANNIAYGCSQADVSEESVIAAAKAAHVMEFIESLPEGIHTHVGENGILLSGGQRQRLAIARAILKNAPILILDEATSALDNESEKYIQSALDEIMEGRTALVIAHRLSTIERSDCIVVMDQGQIIEMGQHAELLDKGGYYYQLYSRTFHAT